MLLLRLYLGLDRVKDRLLSRTLSDILLFLLLSHGRLLQLATLSLLLGLTVQDQVLRLIHGEVTLGGLDPRLLLALLRGRPLPRHRVVIVIGLLIRIAHEDLGNRKLLSSFDHPLARWLFLLTSLILLSCRRFRFALACRLLYLFLDEVYNLLALRSLVWSLWRVLILTLNHARVV